MFKNRKVEVKLVKDEEVLPSQPVRVRILDVDEALVMGTIAVVSVMGAYFLGSTVRACVVHIVAVKVAPPVVQVAS